jgi:hypothetical protein
VGEGIAVTFASGLLYDFDSDIINHGGEPPATPRASASIPILTCSSSDTRTRRAPIHTTRAFHSVAPAGRELPDRRGSGTVSASLNGTREGADCVQRHRDRPGAEPSRGSGDLRERAGAKTVTWTSDVGPRPRTSDTARPSASLALTCCTQFRMITTSVRGGWTSTFIIRNRLSAVTS